MSWARWIDLSNNNGSVDMAAVVADTSLEGLWHKIGEGGTFIDPNAASRLGAAHGHKLIGGYYFAHPGQMSGVTAGQCYVRMVSAVCNAAGIDPKTMLHALDLEVSEAVFGNALAQWCLDWFTTVESALGLEPNSAVFYSYVAYIHDNLGPAAELLTSRRLWIAAYETYAPSPAPWPSIWMWQHSQNAATAGVQGECDENFRLGDLPAAPSEDDDSWAFS